MVVVCWPVLMWLVAGWDPTFCGWWVNVVSCEMSCHVMWCDLMCLHFMKRLVLGPRHIWNVIYNARSNRHLPPTSPDSAPATQNESHAWCPSHMKRHLQCAEQQASPSNLTKYCACHTKWVSFMMSITYETSFTMRGATGITLQPHQMLRLPRKMTVQNLRETLWQQLKWQLQCGDDSTMIRAWSEHELVISHPPVRGGSFSHFGDAFCIENYNISRSGYLPRFHRILRLPQKVTLQEHQILRLPQKSDAPRSLQPHQRLRLPRKMNLMDGVRHIWNVIYNARSNRHHPPTSPNTAPATQNESHAWCPSHMKRHLQCAEQQASPSNLTKCCACHAKCISCMMSITYETSFTMRGATGITLQPHQILRLPHKMSLMHDVHHIWNVIYNARSNRHHPPTSPNAAPATQNDSPKSKKNSLKTVEVAITMRGRFDHRPWSEHELVISHPPVRGGSFSHFGDAFCIENCNISRSGYLPRFHRILRLPQKVTLQEHQLLRLPQKVTLQEHQILRLPQKVTLQDHQILRLPQKVTLQDHQILRLPQKVNCYWAVTQLSCYWTVTELSWTCYSTELLLNCYSSELLLNCYSTELNLLLKWAVTELLLKWAVTELLLNWAEPVTQPSCYWTVTQVSCYWTVTQLSCYWTVTQVSCYWTELLLHF